MEIISIYKLLAKIHDDIENSILCFIKPLIKTYDLCLFIENQIDEQTKSLPYDHKGIAFPVGINMNHCAAHHSPIDSNDTQIITIDDVIKIDYGIHINGYILDAAFTVCFKEDYRDLLETTSKACMEAAKLFYPNTKISNISKKIQSIINNKYNIVKDLCGHQIKPYLIHSGKVIPNILITYEQKILEGEVYTVEPYLSTGSGITKETTDISHYMFNYYEKQFKDYPVIDLIPSLKQRKTLAFHKRWLNEKDKTYLDGLVNKKIYKQYPPIYDLNETSKIAQFETTIIVTKDKPIILKNYNNIDKYIIKLDI